MNGWLWVRAPLRPTCYEPGQSALPCLLRRLKRIRNLFRGMSQSKCWYVCASDWPFAANSLVKGEMVLMISWQWQDTNNRLRHERLRGIPAHNKCLLLLMSCELLETYQGMRMKWFNAPVMKNGYTYTMVLFLLYQINLSLSEYNHYYDRCT